MTLHGGGRHDERQLQGRPLGACPSGRPGCYLPVAGGVVIPLVDPDEGLHASVAQEMVERGDWIVPRMLHQPFLDKPILYFWAVALSLKAFGMSEAAVRLPGLLFGIGNVDHGSLGMAASRPPHGAYRRHVLRHDDSAVGPGATSGPRRGPGPLGQPCPHLLLGIGVLRVRHGGPRATVPFFPRLGLPPPAWRSSG